MRWIISSSGPLARGSGVLVLCLFAGCVQRRADGTRGSDTGSVTGAEIKRDTGIVTAPQAPGSATMIGPDVTLDTAEQPFASAPTGAPVAGSIAPIAPGGSPPPSPQVPAQSPGSATTPTQSDIMELAQHHPIVPISGILAAKLPDTFNELRGGTRKHEALDILAPRGTPVHSADDGTVIKLYTSKAGGLTVYVTGPAQRFVYYYAHLNAYANGLAEGQMLHKGDVLGYVGTTGNADPNVPHLHFAIARTDNIKEWWKGVPIDPTMVLQAGAQNSVR